MVAGLRWGGQGLEMVTRVRINYIIPEIRVTSKLYCTVLSAVRNSIFHPK